MIEQRMCKLYLATQQHTFICKRQAGMSVAELCKMLFGGGSDCFCLPVSKILVSCSELAGAGQAALYAIFEGFDFQ